MNSSGQSKFLIILQKFDLIWFVDLFDRLLLGRLRTYGYQTWQGGRGRARNPAWDIGFHGNWLGATLFKKNSLKAQMLAWWCWFLACHSHLAISICLPKMDKIYQTVIEIRPIATAWQPLSGRASGVRDHLCDIMQDIRTYKRTSWRHAIVNVTSHHLCDPGAWSGWT